MEILIQEIKDKNIWERFLADCREKTFLQSWNWGEFQERMGNKIWRLGIYNNGNPISIILVVKIIAKRGIFLLVQHGPIFNFQFSIIEELKKIAKKEGCDFIRIAPLFPRNKENKKIFKDLGFRESPMHANAYEATWKLDITVSEEELLRKMRKTTRYLIRQTLKNRDIAVEKSEKPEEVEKYIELNADVAKRQKFVPFSPEFIKNEFEVFSPDNQALWFFGKYKGKLAAAALVVFWSGIGFYHQAASRSECAKFSVPYLLLWEAIKEAKKRECVLFDFWGFTDPKKQPNHPWAGPTLFKMGFGGELFEYVKTQDLPLSSKYWLTYFFEKIRKIKRGLQ